MKKQTNNKNRLTQQQMNKTKKINKNDKSRKKNLVRKTHVAINNRVIKHAYNTRTSVNTFKQVTKFDKKARSKSSDFTVLKRKTNEFNRTIGRYSAKNESLEKRNRDLRQKNRENLKVIKTERQRNIQLKKDNSKLKKEAIYLRNSYSIGLITSADLLDQLKEQDKLETCLMSRISVLELAEKEKLHSRNAQQKILDLKDEIIQKLAYENELLKQKFGKEDKKVKLLDIPEEVFRIIFAYLPNAEIVWSFGLTCQKFMEIALRNVWVIEDSISRPPVGNVRDDVIDLTIEDSTSADMKSKHFNCRISSLISSVLVGQSIFHIVSTDNFRHHENILNRIKMLEQNYHPKKVLLLRNRHLKICDILVRFTSQWSQLESIIISHDMTQSHFSSEKLEYILDNSPNLRCIDFSTETGGFLSVDGWSILANKCTNLTQLILYGCNITDEHVKLIITQNKKLVLIEFQRCKMLTVKGVHIILENALDLKYFRLCRSYHDFENNVIDVNPKCISLRSLHLERWKVSSYFVKQIVKNCSKLKYLRIWPNESYQQELREISTTHHELSVIKEFDCSCVKKCYCNWLNFQ